ncbi:hypothetical protein MKX03_002807 [Papaver bracteatum]|nr:hypothetical protein MKX03_002807 [Papaver bracteatum]
MLKLMFGSCKVYTSVSRNRAAVHRGKPGAFRKAVAAMVKPAIDSIDLDLHFGTHPRLRVVDHICFHPLAQTSLEETVWLAKSVAPWLQSSRFWVDNYNVPIFTTNIAAVRRIPKQASGQGGLPPVQVVALAHGEDIIEEACILSEPSKFTADQVQHGVKRLAV